MQKNFSIISIGTSTWVLSKKTVQTFSFQNINFTAVFFRNQHKITQLFERQPDLETVTKLQFAIVYSITNYFQDVSNS